MLKIYYLVFPVFLVILGSVPLMAQTPNQPDTGEGDRIRIRDSEIYYEVYGEGPPVVLLHGGLGSTSDFDSIIPGLSASYRLYAIDSPGHGRSSHIDSLSYPLIADYIAECIKALNLGQAGIVGYSDGAIIGMLVAAKLPERIKYLVFGAGALNPGSSTPEGLKMLRDIHPGILPDYMAESFRKKSPNPERWEEFVLLSKEMWLEDVWIPEGILSEIDIPVLLVYGDRDPFIPLAHGMKIHESLTNSQLCVLPGSGHAIYKQPGLLLPVLTNFMSGN